MIPPNLPRLHGGALLEEVESLIGAPVRDACVVQARAKSAHAAQPAHRRFVDYFAISPAPDLLSTIMGRTIALALAAHAIFKMRLYNLPCFTPETGAVPRVCLHRNTRLHLNKECE